jgi:hypothetical protein
MPQQDQQQGELDLRCSIQPYEGQPILHLEAWKPNNTLGYKISFGLNKAYSLCDVLDVVVFFATEEELPEDPKGCTLEEFEGHAVIVVPHDSARAFSFGHRKAELVAHFAEAVQAFADSKGRSTNSTEQVGSDADAD